MTDSPPVLFHQTGRAAQRAAPWWSRLGYIQRKLPEAIVAGIRRLRLEAGSHVLDFGCADQPYRAQLGAVDYVGADLPGNAAAAAHIAEDGRLPLADGSFDAILSTQVLEHVADPAVYLDECARLLKPGARLLLSTHGLMVWHPDPVDYWRWTGQGLRLQIERAGLRVIDLSGVMGLAATGVQLFQDGLFPRVPTRLRNLFTRLMQGLIAWCDRRETASTLANNALVFVVLAEKPASSPR